MKTRNFIISIFSTLIAVFASAPQGNAGLFDEIVKEVVRPQSGILPAIPNQPTTNPNLNVQRNQAVIPTGPIPPRFIIGSVPETNAPGLGKQTDSWTCGPHVAARLARFYGRGLTYDQAIKDRITIGIPSMEKLTQFDPSAQMLFKTAAMGYGQDALVKIFGSSAEEEKMLLAKYFKQTYLKELAEFDDLKKVIAKNKPVAVMITNGTRQEPALKKLLKKDVKLNYYHWVLAFGYDDATSQLNLSDSYSDQHSVLSYDEFKNRWNTKEHGFFLNVGTGFFIRERTMIWVDE